VISDLKENGNLQIFAGGVDLDVEQIYESLSRFNGRTFINFLYSVQSSVYFRKMRSPAKIEDFVPRT